jgi:lipopolysaccharide transport system permease protein
LDDAATISASSRGGTRPSYRSGRRGSLRDVWAQRELLFRMFERNLKVKYQRSALGFVWTLFNPLGTVIILIAVFSYIVRIDMPNYWAFLVSGYFVFNFVIQMLNTASTVLPEHAQLTKSAPFPSEILVFGATIARLFEFVIAMSIVLLVLVVFHHGGVPASFVLLPVLVVIQLLLVLGVVLPISIASVFFHDLEHALPVAVMMLFYISPVFYPISFVPEAVHGIYYLNPLSGLITLFHAVVYEGVFPSPVHLGVVAVVSVASCVIGYSIFNRYKGVCAELV